MPFPCRSRSAFTLIELLVVIAIIALLAAILFPAFARVRGMARRTVCQSNMKQIGLGVQQYIQDYDEILPPRATFGDTPANLQNLLQPYVKSYQVFQCPGNEYRDKTMNDDPANVSHVSYAPNTKAGATDLGSGGGGDPDDPGGPITYDTNAGSGSSTEVDNGGLYAKNDYGDKDPYNVTMVSLAAIQYPSSTISFLESNAQSSDFSINRDFFGNGSKCGIDKNGAQDEIPCLNAAHFGFSNFLFADGHVKAMRPETTLKPVNMWNRDNIEFKGLNADQAEYAVRYSSIYYKNR